MSNEAERTIYSRSQGSDTTVASTTTKRETDSAYSTKEDNTIPIVPDDEDDGKTYNRLSLSAFISSFKFKNSLLYRFFIICIICGLSFLPGLTFLSSAHTSSKHNQKSENYLIVAVYFSIYLLGYFVFDILFFGLLSMLDRLHILKSSNILYYMRESRSLVSLLVWNFGVLITFLGHCDEDLFATVYEKVPVNNTLAILIFVTILLLLHRQFILSLAINVNSANYFLKVHQSLHNVEALKRLMKLSKEHYERTKRAGAGKNQVNFFKKVIDKSTSISSVFGVKEATNDTIIKMKNAVECKKEDAPTQCAKSVNLLMKEYFNSVSKETSIYDISVSDNDKSIRSHAKEVTRKLSKYLSNGDKPRRFFSKNDISIFLNENEAKRISTVFLTDNTTESIPAEYVEEGIFQLYKERHSLARNLTTMKTAVHNTSKITLLVVLVVTIIFATTLSGFDMKQLAVFHSTFVVGFAFIFGNTGKTVFECMIFLFSNHPFDIGDRIFLPVQNSPTVYHDFIVTNITLLVTEFQRKDGLLVYYPNAVLATQMIVNVRRSGCLRDTHHVKVSSSNSPESLAALKSKIFEFVNMYSDTYTQFVLFNLNTIHNSSKVKISISLQYKEGIYDPEMSTERQNVFSEYLNEALSDLKIE